MLEVGSRWFFCPGVGIAVWSGLDGCSLFGADVFYGLDVDMEDLRHLDKWSMDFTYLRTVLLSSIPLVFHPFCTVS